MAKSTKTSAGKKSAAGKRTTIAPNDDKRYVKRNKEGQFTESDDQGKSLSMDVKQTAKNKVKPGYGDKGDQAAKTSPAKKAAGKSATKKK